MVPGTELVPGTEPVPGTESVHGTELVPGTEISGNNGTRYGNYRIGTRYGRMMGCVIKMTQLLSTHYLHFMFTLWELRGIITQ